MNDQPTRSRRRLWIATSTIAGVVVLAAAVITVVTSGYPWSKPSSCADDPTAYKFKRSNTQMEIEAISSNGEYIVKTPEISDDDVLFSLWHNGKVSGSVGPNGEIDGGIAEESPISVNDHGDVVGTQASSNKAWRYVNGNFQVLKTPGDSTDTALQGINNDGTVVGRTSLHDKSVPLKWEAGETEATQLDIGSHDYGDAVDISEDGVIVGLVGDGSHPDPTDDETQYDAWRWDADGKGKQMFDFKTIPHKPGIEVAGGSQASSITGDWVRFIVKDEFAPEFRVKLTNLSEPESLGDMKPVALDSTGRAFGVYKDRPVVYDKKPVKLPGLSKPPARGEDDVEEDMPKNEIRAVSDDGSITAGQTWKGDNIVWTCR